MEDINAQDSVGWTKLHLAASRNDHVGVKLLLDQKANPHIYTDVGNSPLMLSAFDKSKESFRILLKYETHETFNRKNRQNTTTLDFVVNCNMYNHATWIVDAGGGHSTRDPPPWFKNLIQKRRNIKHTLLVFHHLGRKNPYLKKDMTDNIVRMIWETRDREEWLTPQEGPSLKKMKI